MSNPFRVLIVDDHVDSAESLAELLRLGGHNTRMAHDGWHALLLARAWQPQVILLDLGLPGLDGHEVARRVRAADWSSDTLLIALSGWGGEEIRNESMAAGFNHHMIKPVDVESLDRLMAQASQPQQSLAPSPTAQAVRTA